MTDFRTFQFNRNQKGCLYILFGLLGGVLSLLFYQNILFGMILMPFFPKIRSFLEKECLERRRREYLVQFKDFLFVAATSIGGGRSMRDAIGEAIPRLVDIYGEDGILIRELECVHHRISCGNEDDLDVLMDLALLSNQEDVVDFVTIYASCKVTGASLIRGMNQAAMVIIDKMTIEREIAELVRRKEREGLVILTSPILVILFLNLAAPDYIAPLYETIRGRIIMTSVIAATIGVYELIQRIVKVSI